jgi:hypothetical protein
MFLRRILLVQKGWTIKRIPFGQRKFRLTGYQSIGIGRRENSGHILTEMHSYNFYVEGRVKRFRNVPILPCYGGQPLHN